MEFTSSSCFTNHELMMNNGNELLHVLQELEKRLERVQQMPPESMKYAMQPAIKTLIATELLRHPDTEVNISVACCICEVFRIMVYETPYNDEQMKDFFELVVITFEKLSSGSGRCYDRMIKVLTTLDSGKFSVMMCDLQLDGLIVRLFKQFLTVAESNSLAVVIKIKQIMAMIIEKTELVNHKLVDLLVNNVREDNKTSSPVCWQLGRDVLMKCAAQLKPHLPKKVAEEVYSPSMETIPSTTRKRKLECLDGRRNMVRPVRRCQDIKKHEKKTISTDDPPMPTKSVTEAQSVEHGENLVGRRIKVWWPRDKIYYQGVVKFFDCRNKRHKVLYDDGEEEILDLKQEKWKLAEMASRLSTFEIKLMNAGKGLLILPSSTVELLNVLEVAKEECNSLGESIYSPTDTSRNRVQPVRSCKDATRHTVNLPHINSEVEKNHENKTLSSHDPPMPSTSVIEVLYDDGEEELLDLKQEQWKLAEMASRLSTFEVKLMNAGKRPLILPLSTVELLNVLEQMEKLLHRAQLHKGKQTLSESMKYAMRPIIEALVAKELLRHPDMDVNISVACCICDVLRIMDDNAPYNNEQMKDFFELAVTTFEKLSSASGGCYTKLFKVLKTLSGLSFSVLESDLRLNGLIIRLFKQFLTVAESNSDDVVLEMKKILTIIIEESEPLNLELVDLLVTSVRKENEITSPVFCWKLGNEVLKKCAAKVKPHLPDQVVKEECNSLGESIYSTANTSRNRVQPVRSCKDATRHTVNLLHINSEVEKNHENKTLSSHDPPMPSTSVIEASSDDDNEELIDLKGKQRELLENVSATPDSAPPPGDIISVQGYSVKQSIAPILEAIFNKHGNIAADCFFREASVRTTFLEAICEVVRLIETSDVTTIVSKMEEIEFQVSEADAANIDVSWLQAQLKDIHTRNEALEKTNSLMEMKVNTILVKRAARTDLIEIDEELEERCVKVEECIKVIDLVEDKPIRAKRAARVELRKRCRELAVAQEQFAKAERCVKVLDIVEEKLTNNILESKAESTHG